MARGLILAVRHPRPIVSARTCIGRTDVGLAAPAEEEAARLLTAIDEPIERIVSSPLRRALEVARALARQTAAPLHADDRLTDQDFGAWEGKAWASLSRLETVAWQSDPIHYAPGGGESVAAMLRRVRHAWTRLASSEETTLVMTHAGPIQCLLHIAAAMKLTDALARSVPYGAVVRLASPSIKESVRAGG
jgi:alpha-ribazole phosphatase